MPQQNKYQEQVYSDFGGGMVTRLPPFTLKDNQVLLLRNFRYERSNNPSVRGGLHLISVGGGA